MKQRLARAALEASGLPSLGPISPSREDETRFASAAEDLLVRAERPSDMSLVTLLGWIAQCRPVLFHGSTRDDLRTLEPIRRTRDSTPFGDQLAVFAASDPVWAIYFATLHRGAGFRSTRNGSIGIPDALYPRWYFFSHNVGAELEDRFGDGWLYVLPRAVFRPEPSRLGVLDSGQWVSQVPVTPLARIGVSPADFPFIEHVFSHRLDQKMVTTFLRAIRLGRRRR